MKLIGFVLLIVGLLTLAAHFLHWQHATVDWVGNWGEGAAWGIRGGATVLGLLLLSAGGKGKKKG